MSEEKFKKYSEKILKNIKKLKKLNSNEENTKKIDASVLVFQEFLHQETKKNEKKESLKMTFKISQTQNATVMEEMQPQIANAQQKNVNMEELQNVNKNDSQPQIVKAQQNVNMDELQPQITNDKQNENLEEIIRTGRDHPIALKEIKKQLTFSKKAKQKMWYYYPYFLPRMRGRRRNRYNYTRSNKNLIQCSKSSSSGIKSGNALAINGGLLPTTENTTINLTTISNTNQNSIIPSNTNIEPVNESDLLSVCSEQSTVSTPSLPNLQQKRLEAIETTISSIPMNARNCANLNIIPFNIQINAEKPNFLNSEPLQQPSDAFISNCITGRSMIKREIDQIGSSMVVQPNLVQVNNHQMGYANNNGQAGQGEMEKQQNRERLVNIKREHCFTKKSITYSDNDKQYKQRISISTIQCNECDEICTNQYFAMMKHIYEKHWQQQNVGQKQNEQSNIDQKKQKKFLFLCKIENCNYRNSSYHKGQIRDHMQLAHKLTLKEAEEWIDESNFEEVFATKNAFFRI